MYESFFGLKERPFSIRVDPRFLWLSETHDEGLAAIHYGLLSREGLVVLTGEVGAGKTTLLHAALERLPPLTDVAFLSQTARLSGLDMHKFIAAYLEIGGRPRTRADYLIALHTHLLARFREGRSTVLIIDEAQNLPIETLKELQLLSNLEADRRKLLQIVLTGQPELRQTLLAPPLEPLRQRIVIDHHVERLRPDEIAPYLAHRIQVAGGRYAEVLEPGAESVFHALSAGCPRLINLFADQVLLSSFAHGMRPARREAIEKLAGQIEAARTVAGQEGAQSRRAAPRLGLVRPPMIRSLLAMAGGGATARPEPVADATEPTRGDELAELRRRVAALEQVVFAEGASARSTPTLASDAPEAERLEPGLERVPEQRALR